jgi:hypothetical protein
MLYALNEIRAKKKIGISEYFSWGMISLMTEITQKGRQRRMISGFRREADENCALLGHSRCSLRNNPDERSSQ